MHVENEWQINLYQWQLVCSNSLKQVESEVTTGKGRKYALTLLKMKHQTSCSSSHRLPSKS